jgi:hypothetical protein
VLGDHPLDLDQQPSLGIVEGRGVSETDHHVEAGEFLEDEDLVRVRPGQAIWRKTPDDVDDAGFGRVAQGIQPGRSRRAPEYPSSMNSPTSSSPSAATLARSVLSCEPIVPRASWASVDTRA